MLFALAASVVVASLSLIGALFLGTSISTERLHRTILPGAVGIFLGVIFFELVPETIEASELWGPVAILFGFLGFYLLSHYLDTYHHHHTTDHDDCAHGGARRLLIGDAVHNFADGIVIATGFLVNPVVGLLTTVGIALHEIPQEIAEYGILRSLGYSAKKALSRNFLSATTVVLGVLVTYLFGEALHEYIFVLTGIAAGNLLYIATADLIPELRHSHREHFTRTFITTLIGVVLIGGIIITSHELMGHEEHSEETEIH